VVKMSQRRFIATVNRVESVKKLRRTFNELGGLGPTVQVRQSGENVKSVAESDVILLWFGSLSLSPSLPLSITLGLIECGK